MKYKNRVKKLKDRQEEFDKAKASAPSGSKRNAQYSSGGFTRPGSTNK